MSPPPASGVAAIREGTSTGHGLWKKGQATLEDYRDAVGLCREKIRRAKTHLELTAVKDNQMYL